MLNFHGDAIELSGETGTKLKSEIIGKYYPLWWSITSGGQRNNFSKPTAIVEMNAGTGEDYIKDTDKTILGSSGHALQLKAENQNTSQLKIILVEKDSQCFFHLQNVITRNWPKLQFATNTESNNSDVYLLNIATSIPEIIENIELGNVLFFFDPLLYTPWSEIEGIAHKRIKRYYQTQTEFIVFLFTSDWFLGRGDLAPLPTDERTSNWNSQEQKTVSEMDGLFGHMKWRSYLLNSKHVDEKMRTLVELYRERLHRWFRYVLPLPFTPKNLQIYHLFMCSNYEVGVRITRDFYTIYTDNPKYSPDNNSAYSKFLKIHPEMKRKGTARSYEWKILWKIIREHEEGICDARCLDLHDELLDYDSLKNILEWLSTEKYIKQINYLTDAWKDMPNVYRINWNIIKERLDIDSPLPLVPLASIEHRKIDTTNNEKKPKGLDRFF
jgi:three-Cys-motif partner protein